MSFYNRRKFLTTTAGAAGALAIAGALGTPALAQDRRIRQFWWGNPERDKRTFAVIEIFNGKNPGIVVEGETLGFADYFTKLTTQIAGGNMPRRDPAGLWRAVRIYRQWRRGAARRLCRQEPRYLQDRQERARCGHGERQILCAVDRRQFACGDVQYPPL